MVTPVAQITGMMPKACAMFVESVNSPTMLWNMISSSKKNICYKYYFYHPDVPVQQTGECAANDKSPEGPRKAEKDHGYAEAREANKKNWLSSNAIGKTTPV
jgi:hypothetical protein